MRHVWSLIAGVVVALAGWFALALVSSVYAKVSDDDQQKYVALAILIVTGLLFGAVGSMHNSPLGALFVSLAYLGLSVGPLLGLYDTPTLGTWSLFEYKLDWESPVLFLAVVGAMMFMAVFSPSRWRGATPASDPNAWTPPPPPAPWTPPSSLPPDSTTPPTEEIHHETRTDKLY